MIRPIHILALCLALGAHHGFAEQQHNGGGNGFQQLNQQQNFRGSMAMGATQSAGGGGGGGGGGSAQYQKNKDVNKSAEFAKEAAKEMNETAKSFTQTVEKMSTSFGQALEKTKIPENTKLLDELAKNATNVPSGEGVGKTAVDDIINATKALSEIQTQTIQALALSLQPPKKPVAEPEPRETVADRMAIFVSGRTAGGGRFGRSPLGLAANAAPIGNATPARGIASAGGAQPMASGRGVTSVDPGLTYKAPSLKRR